MSQAYGYAAYKAYCHSFGDKQKDGTPRLHWDDLSEMTRKAWSDAADAVVLLIIQKPKEPEKPK